MSSKLVLTFDTGTTENILNNQYTGATFGFKQDVGSTNFILEQISGGTSSGSTVGDYLALSGGTVTGETIFDAGLSAVTFTGDSILVTGITANTITTDQLSAVTFTGDSILVTGLTANTITTDQLSAVTFTGDSILVTGLTANTITTDQLSATTFTANTEYIIGKIPTSEVGSVNTGNLTYNLYIQGKYAYVIKINALEIFDISDPTPPVSIGSAVLTSSYPTSLYVQGKYAYVTNAGVSNNLQIFDVSDPTSPVSIGTVSTGTLFGGVYVQGKYAYVINQGPYELKIFDVSDPTSPVSIGSVPTSLSLNPSSLYVQGKYVYVTSFTVGNSLLEIFDVSDPASPVSIGTVSTTQYPYDLYVQGKYAYVASYSYLEIFDVSDATSPVSVGTISTGPPTSYGVYVQGKYAYVVNQGSSTLQIFDVSDPTNTVSLGTVSTGGLPNKVKVQGKYAYVAGNNYLKIFDLGGSYIQQLEAGGILTSTFESIGNATIGNDLTVVGGLNVSQSTNIQSDLSSINLNVISGASFNSLSANTISATTYLNLPTTISAATFTSITVNEITATTIDLCSTNGTLYTDSISGCSPINFLSEGNFTQGVSATTFTGDSILVTGLTADTIYTSGLTADTISAITGIFSAITADTIYTSGLTADTILVTGLTADTISAITGIFSAITADTILVTGLTADTIYTSGLTADTILVTGLTADTIYTSGLTADTISAITGIFSAITADTIYTSGLTATTIDLCSTNGTLYTDSISGCSPINFLSEGNFTQGVSATTITADTISASTYLNMPVGQYVELDASMSAVTYELPEITEGIIGDQIILKAISVTSGITILPYSSNTIDGSGSYIFGSLSGESIIVQAEVNDWKIISAYLPISNLDINSTYNFNFTFDELSEYFGGIYNYGTISFTPPNDGAVWSAESRNEVYLQNELVYGECAGGVTTGFTPDLIYNISETSGIIYVDIRILPGLPAQFPEDANHLEDPYFACYGYYTGYARLNITRNSVVVKIVTISYVMDLQPPPV